MSDRSQRFADALRQHEEGDSQALLNQFTDGAVLQRPQARRGPGAEADAPAFWQQYLAEFEQVSSEFTRITEAGDEGILEWRSTGRLANGRPIDYRGVSLLTFDGDQVARFATYYDTAAFVEPAE